MSHRDLEAGMSMPGEHGVVGIVGHHRSSIGYSFGTFSTHPVHSRNLRISAKMGFSCLIEISKLVCPCHLNMVSLEPWGIIGVPLDIHLGHFLSIPAKMGFSCLIEISKLVCPYQGTWCRWNREISWEFHWIFIWDIFTHFA